MVIKLKGVSFNLSVVRMVFEEGGRERREGGRGGREGGREGGEAGREGY